MRSLDVSSEAAEVRRLSTKWKRRHHILPKPIRGPSPKGAMRASSRGIRKRPGPNPCHNAFLFEFDANRQYGEFYFCSPGGSRSLSLLCTVGNPLWALRMPLGAREERPKPRPLPEEVATCLRRPPRHGCRFFPDGKHSLKGCFRPYSF